MRAIPAVSDIGATSIIPNAFNNTSRRFFPEGTGAQGARGPVRAVSAAPNSGYFAAMKIPLIRGRQFDDSDRVDGVQVAIVSSSLAPVTTGATATRSASDSSSRSTDRGSRSSACRATSCTTGSCGEFETVYRPLTPDGAVLGGVCGAHGWRSERPGRRSAARGVEGRRRSADRIAGVDGDAGRGTGRRALPSSRGRSAWSARLRWCCRLWASTA